ncbi:hypothetical protein C8R44DRAFT_736517 [Mycena epipterygia]|nr:hypothetical protein C8R44DRAFT_736517 [Mycena epipterygia]
MTRELISDPVRTAKTLEARSLVAFATEFYLGATRQFCTGKNVDAQFECGGRAALRKFKEGTQNGKAYFIGCSNWSNDDDLLIASRKFRMGCGNPSCANSSVGRR